MFRGDRGEMPEMVYREGFGSIILTHSPHGTSRSICARKVVLLVYALVGSSWTKDMLSCLFIDSLYQNSSVYATAFLCGVSLQKHMRSSSYHFNTFPTCRKIVYALIITTTHHFVPINKVHSTKNVITNLIT